MDKMIDLSESPLADMKLVGGRLCLDFANTLGGRIPAGESYTIREERLNDYFDLVSWGTRTKLLSAADARFLVREASDRQSDATVVWKRAVALREAIYRALKAILVHKRAQPDDLCILNEELKLARLRMEMVPGKEGFRWQWIDQNESLDGVLWAVVESAAELFTEGDLSRVRQCPGEDCGWLFDDTSRNRSRQWCDMSDCGNIAKVRAYRSRKEQPDYKQHRKAER